MAWEQVQKAVHKAQNKQKHYYDKLEQNAKFNIVDRVFVCMLAKKTGPMRKLPCLFQGPYCIMEIYPNRLNIRPVEKPAATSIRVAMDRVRHCLLKSPNCLPPRVQSRSKMKSTLGRMTKPPHHWSHPWRWTYLRTVVTDKKSGRSGEGGGHSRGKASDEDLNLKSTLKCCGTGGTWGGWLCSKQT